MTLLGWQALDYIRERGNMEDKTNVARMERQMQYITAWRTAFFEARQQDESILLDLWDQLDPYVVTNINTYEIDAIADAVETYTSKGFITLEECGESQIVDGHTQFVVDDAALKDLVVELFYEPVKTDSNA